MGAKEGQRVIGCTSVIDCDVPKHVLFNFLGQVDIDTEEVGCSCKVRGTLEQKKREALTIGLSFLNSLEQVLEPSERRCITTNPEEFDTSKGTKSSLPLSVPDVFENRSKWGYTYRKRFTIEDYNNIEGILPIPAPIKIATSQLKTSSAAAP